MGIQQFNQVLSLVAPFYGQPQPMWQPRTPFSGDVSVAVDWMITLHSIENAEPATGDELAARMVRPYVGEWLAAPEVTRVRIYFATDRQQLKRATVPKARTATARAAARAAADARAGRTPAQPYPDAAEFLSDGVREAAGGAVALIDPRRLIASRSSRAIGTWWSFLELCARAEVLSLQLANASVWFDLDDAGADNEDELEHKCVCGPYGEADIALLEWVGRAAGDEHVHVYTTDTDFALLFFTTFLDRRVARTLWHNGQGAMLAVSELLPTLAEHGWRWQTLLASAILTGCDFFEKKLGIANVGTVPLWTVASAAVRQGEFADAVRSNGELDFISFTCILLGELCLEPLPYLSQTCVENAWAGGRSARQRSLGKHPVSRCPRLGELDSMTAAFGVAWSYWAAQMERVAARARLPPRLR
jgi:hypothetical protein